MKNTKYGTWIALLILGGFALMIYFNQSDKTRLVKDNVVFNGIVFETYGSGNKGSKLGLRYYFQVNQKRYEGSTSFQEHSYSESYNFLGKSFPIVYEINNPSNSEMLLDKDDFDRYDVPMNSLL